MGEGNSFNTSRRWGYFFFSSFQDKEEKKNMGPFFLFPSRFCLLKDDVQSSPVKVLLLGVRHPFNEIFLPLAIGFLTCPFTHTRLL